MSPISKIDLTKFIKKQIAEFRRKQYLWPVIIVYERKTNYYMAVYHGWFFHILFVDSLCQKMPESSIKYLIAHELMHCVEPMLTEREVDMKVIEIGFKEEIISFHEWHNERFRKYKKKDGLTLSEILRT